MARKSNTTDTDTGSSADDVAALKAELAQFKARATTAEAEASTFKSRARDAELASMSADERAIVSAQEAADTAYTSLESEIETYENQIALLADEPGHGKEIAGLTRKIGQASAKLETAGQRKDYLTQQREALTTKGKQRQQQETAEATAEKIADGTPITAFKPATQAWIRNHPDLFNNPMLVKKARIAAAEATEVEGLTDNSQEFFEYLEGKLGFKAAPQTQQEQEQTEEDVLEEVTQRAEPERYEPEKPQQRAAGPGAMAPVVQRALAPQGGSGTQRRVPALTAQEKEVADSLYGSIKNPADRYLRYAQNRQYMDKRETSHFRN